jgi:hypothetical protein
VGGGWYGRSTGTHDAPPQKMSTGNVGGEDGWSRSRKVGLLWPYALGAGVGLACVATMPFLIVPWLPLKVFGALPYMHTPQKKLDALFTRVLPRLRPATQESSAARFLDLGSGAGVMCLSEIMAPWPKLP